MQSANNKMLLKNADEPEIIIVVDKLLTGFDAPRNAILYLTRNLAKDHTLLQAIARVNRLYDGKDFGYVIDYRVVLENLDNALDVYGRDYPNLKARRFGRCAQRCQSRIYQNCLSDIIQIFGMSLKKSKNISEMKKNMSVYSQNEAKRDQFYERLSIFSRTLAIALASVKFMEDTPKTKVQKIQE